MSRVRPAARVHPVAAALVGFAQGVFLFAALLGAELIALGDDRAVLGAPFPGILAVYLFSGAAIGVAAGLVAWAAARIIPLRPGRLSGALVAFACVALFVLRSVPSHQLAGVSPRVIGVLVAGVALVVGAVVWGRRGADEARSYRPGMRVAGVTAIALAGIACLASALWVPVRYHHLTPHADASPDAPNIVFVLIDALRQDRLGTFGYTRPTSPVIDRLASEGTAFLDAYSQGNRTIIAMPSLFTSMYPSYARTIVSGHWDTPLPDSQTTIAEMCRAQGYTTLGMMSNPYLKRPFGLTQGFDRVEEFNAGRFKLSLYRIVGALRGGKPPRYVTGLTASATEVTDAALAWLGRVPRQAPFFCYVHYMDVHHPYVPPAEYDSMFCSDPRLEKIGASELFAKTVTLVKERRPNPLGEDDLTRLSDLYDGCIRYVDTQIGRLADAALRVNDRPTIIVVTSDHGDEFQQHEHLYHTNLVIEDLIRVPLVIWRSDRTDTPRRVPDLIRHVDVLPTIADWIGAPVPAAAVGRSLSVFLEGGQDQAHRASIAEGDYCAALVEPGWKFMRVDTTGTDALFDLDADPDAYLDVASVHPDRFGQMKTSLDSYQQAAPQGGPGDHAVPAAAILKQLKALGYVN